MGDAFLGAAFLSEFLGTIEMFLMALLFLGIFLVATKSFHHLRNISAEKGVLYALIATFGMGVVNFLVGYGARITSPLLVNWFFSAFITAFSFFYLLSTGRLREVRADWKKFPALLFSVCFFNNLAWIAFAFSVLTIPIAISIGITEGYVALAASLGLLVNRERLVPHQFFGLVLTVIAVIALSVIT